MVLCVLLTTPAGAQALCIHNNLNVKIRACADFCSECMMKSIPPGGKICCPADGKGCKWGGLITISLLYDKGPGCSGWNSGHPVDADGWVVFSGWCMNSSLKCQEEGMHSCDGAQAAVYSKDGSVQYQGRVYFGQRSCGW
eukprot:TRINITY_DN135711_c0_g1_i1.p3 TRINITY_DN135711_c0_g1~~TRINITY_DN135711_c0_g1_i1.p3  ORF type:complete len:140 (+),score=26.99 TRINITY_DN135711_c0_g1_i1:303-722(+)